MSMPPTTDKAGFSEVDLHAVAGRLWREQPTLKERNQSSTWCVVYPPDREADISDKQGVDEDTLSHASSRTVEVMPRGSRSLPVAEDCGSPASQLTISPRSPRKVQEAGEGAAEGRAEPPASRTQEVESNGADNPNAALAQAQASPPFFWRRQGGANVLLMTRPSSEEPKSPPEARLPRDVTLVRNPQVFRRTEVKTANAHKGSPSQWRMASSASTALPSNASTSSSSTSAQSGRTTRRVVAYANVPSAVHVQHTVSTPAPPRSAGRRAAGNLQSSPRSAGSPIRTLASAAAASPREVRVARSASPRTKTSRTESPKMSRTPAAMTAPKAAVPKVARQESPRLKSGSLPSSAVCPARPKKGAARPESPDRTKARRPPGATKEDTRCMASPDTTRTSRKSIDTTGEAKATPGDLGFLVNQAYLGSQLSLSLSSNSLLHPGDGKLPLRPLGGGYSLTAPSGPSRTAPCNAARVDAFMALQQGRAKSMLVPAAKPMAPQGAPARQHPSHVPLRSPLASGLPQYGGSRSWQPCTAAGGYPGQPGLHRIV